MQRIRLNAADALGRLSLWATVWVVVSGSLTDGWIVGAPTVALATAASLALRRRQRHAPRPLALLAFTGFFLWQSVRGGFDVARRALDPRLPIAPGFVEYRMRLDPGPARVLAVDVASLLPGTLSVELVGDRLQVHVIDRRIPAEPALLQIERRVAALLGLEWPH